MFPELIEKNQIVKKQIYNLSGRNLSEAISYFPPDLSASKIVLLPDLNPGRSPLPTGCMVQIEERYQPNWRKYVVSDVGCGIQVLSSGIGWQDFEDHKNYWDEVFNELKINKGELGDLGSGNHFLDAAVDDQEQVHFIIHTGSRGESQKVNSLVDQPEEFDQTYAQIISWARSNRNAIADVLENVYKTKLSLIVDKIHNFYSLSDGQVYIYKGAVELKPGEVTIIPSSMDGGMYLVEGTDSMVSIDYAMSHGTGRIKSRSKLREESQDYDFRGLRSRIYIPSDISDRSILTDIPTGFREIEECLSLLDGLIIKKKRMIPIAYIGQF